MTPRRSGPGSGGGSPEVDPDGMEKVTRVSDHVFSSPRPWHSLVPLLLFSVVMGLLLEGSLEPFPLFRSATVVFLVPALLASILSVPISNGLGGRLYLRRSTLMASIALGVMIAMWLVFRLMDVFLAIPQKPMMVLVLTFPLFLWHTVLCATSDRRHARTVWSSGLHPVLGLVGYNMVDPLSAGEVMFAAGLMVVILLSVSVFTNIARAPLKRNFHWDGLELVKHLLAHWTEGVKEGVLGMEAFFRSFSVRASVRLGILAFRRTGDKRPKGVIVLPGAHPGPFGHLAGSNMPAKITPSLESEEKDGTFVMVPHSACTHDMNPVSTDQTVKIGIMAKRMLRKVSYSEGATRFSRKRADGMSVTYQTFGDTLVLVHDPGKRARDDIGEHIGEVVHRYSEAEGVPNTLFMDAHNCIERGSEVIYHHSPEGRAVVETAEEAIRRSLVSKKEPLRVGYAQDTSLTVEAEGVGPTGIQAMVVATADQMTAYVLIDGNNMVAGLARAISRAVSGEVDECVVMTTDNHVANVTMGGYNPIGARGADQVIKTMVRRVVKRAKDDLEECEVGGAEDTISLRVFGRGATARMTASINATMSVMRLGAAVGLALTFTGALVWHHLLDAMGYF